MLAYFCVVCSHYYQEAELLDRKRCPECKGKTKPRLILAGQIMGKEEDAPV